MTTITVSGEVGRWEAHDAGQPVGVLRALTRPDQRTFVSFRDCRPDAYRPLLEHADAALGPDVFTRVDRDDHAEVRRLRDLGFEVAREEHRYRVPVDPGKFRLAGPSPTAVMLTSAAAADLDRLRLLDDTLRHDTPGGQGWRWSPEEFREETFSDDFDPATYQVAVEQRTGEYVGLMRLWMKPGGPRFGYIGVRRPWRRTRVTYALLSTVFTEVHRRGWTHAEAEIDVTNRASNGIAARAGAVRIGGAYEMCRVRPSRAGSG